METKEEIRKEETTEKKRRKKGIAKKVLLAVVAVLPVCVPAFAATVAAGFVVFAGVVALAVFWAVLLSA